MRVPGWKGDGAREQGRHALDPPSKPWARPEPLVLICATMLCVLLVGILVGMRPDDHNGSGGASPAPTNRIDAGTPPADPPTAAPSDSPPVPPVPAGAQSGRTAPPPPTVRVVAGEGCPGTTASGYYSRGWSRDWYARSAGGWTGDGCTGRVVSVPMSGDRNADDPDNVVVWWFRLPAGSTCAVAVFVPGTGDVLDAAGAPATYLVYATTAATGAPIATLTVDQVHNQGRWVEAGTVRPAGDQLAVRLATRGTDWGRGRADAHLGVSALRLRC
jgi:hypothetical protein